MEGRDLASHVDLDREDGVAFITLNRPDKLNAMNEEMWAEVGRVWDEFAADADLRAAVVSGAGGRAFSTGMDLKERAAAGDPRAREFWTSALARDPGRREPVWKPMIAAVQGYCLAGGFEIALSCDIRICSEDASFGLPEIRRGFFPGSSGTVRLPRIMPLGMALEMLYTGASISADEAFRCGLVNRVVPGDELMAAAGDLARAIADGPPLAIRAVKEVVLRGLDLPLSDAIRFEAGFRAMVGGTEDAREGPAAFGEKRKPRFRGR